MVTEAEVWAALAEVPDPELPVVSLVDLGVVHTVEVGGGRVRVELVPTFLGCPALDAMRAGAAAAVARLGAEADVTVVTHEAWSTDRITPAGREKLRAAGIGPPAPRPAEASGVVALTKGVFRCPWCGSTATRLDNLFGATPCRSLRWCASCRQPFEQLKTI
jgi:ring-1,2-phenylacetyl-CoA epoxidase subunit PaaD